MSYPKVIVITDALRKDFDKYLNGEIQLKEVAKKHKLSTGNMNTVSQELIRERLRKHTKD